MSNLVVLGLKDDPTLWLVDLDKLTVTKQGTRPTGGDYPAEAVEARGDGFATNKGVDFAVVVATLDEAATFQTVTQP